MSAPIDSALRDLLALRLRLSAKQHLELAGSILAPPVAPVRLHSFRYGLTTFRAPSPRRRAAPMADGTHIEWTDAPWNVVNGCSVTSPGCTNCYAMRLAGTRLRKHPSRAGLTRDSKAGPVWTGETRFNEKVLQDPLKWKRPRRIFVCAHGDLFHESVPDEWVDRVFAGMVTAPRHTLQVLTKRSARMREYLTARWRHMGCDMNVSNRIASIARDIDPKRWTEIGRILPGWPLPNVWLGVSVEDHDRVPSDTLNLRHCGSVSAGRRGRHVFEILGDSASVPK